MKILISLLFLAACGITESNRGKIFYDDSLRLHEGFYKSCFGTLTEYRENQLHSDRCTLNNFYCPRYQALTNEIDVNCKDLGPLVPEEGEK